MRREVPVHIILAILWKNGCLRDCYDTSPRPPLDGMDS